MSNGNIPSANQIREKYTPNTTPDDNWWLQVYAHIKREMEKAGADLVRGERLILEPPVMRDMGEFRRIWNANLEAVKKVLDELGYDCSFSTKHDGVNSVRVLHVKLGVVVECEKDTDQ